MVLWEIKTKICQTLLVKKKKREAVRKNSKNCLLKNRQIRLVAVFFSSVLVNTKEFDFDAILTNLGLITNVRIGLF